MALIVQKFGGSSVADADKIRRVAGIITKTYEAGNDVIVVVSAQGDTTDDLIDKAHEISKNPSRREMDMLLTTGEQISCSLLAMAIQEMGYPAISLTAWQYGLTSDSNYSNARIKSINDERLCKELDSHKIIICAGFQGINKYDDITTLGRGGSDTTAVAIAAALKADLCQIYTDVDGVYTADPRKVKNAKKLDEITYDEMLELATLGAQVLCNRSVELAKKYGVKLEVCSSYEPKPGTKVKEEVNTLEKMLITGVAKDNDISRISVLGLKDIPGEAFKLFTLLGQNKVNVDIILQSIGRDGTKDISFTVSKANMRATVDLLREKYPDNKVIHEENITKVSIVGAGMQSNAGVAAKLFEALYNVGVNIQMISTSEIKISVLIDSKDEAAAVESIHDAFMV